MPEMVPGGVSSVLKMHPFLPKSMEAILTGTLCVKINQADSIMREIVIHWQSQGIQFGTAGGFVRRTRIHGGAADLSRHAIVIQWTV